MKKNDTTQSGAAVEAAPDITEQVRSPIGGAKIDVRKSASFREAARSRARRQHANARVVDCENPAGDTSRYESGAEIIDPESAIGGAKIDVRKSASFREAARSRAIEQWTPEARAKQSELTREKMRAPGVRELIAANTKLATERVFQIRLLHMAWQRADAEVRAQFLADIIK